MADLLGELFEEAAASGQLDEHELNMDDGSFVQLLDSMADDVPSIQLLREILAERRSTGWTRIERRQ